MNRRNFIQTTVASIGAYTLVGPAFADTPYPSKAIRTIVPTSAGGSTDAVARLYGEYVSKLLKQSLVIENMPGAATLLGIRALVRAPADGYTLAVMANTVTTLPYVEKNAGYVLNDLAGVSYLAKSPMMLVVSANSPYHSVADLVAAAKKDPDGISYASVGEGTTSHLPVALFARAAKIKMMMVLYKGITLAIPDVITERVTAMIGTRPSVGELIKSGKLRALAVTSAGRLPTHPDVPTFAELGYPDAIYELFLGLMAPAKTPAPVIRALSDAFEAVKKEPEFIKRLENLDQELPTQTTPEQFTAFLKSEESRMKPLLKNVQT